MTTDDRGDGEGPGRTVPACSYWDLSTAHVTPADLGLIHGSGLLSACGYAEGAFVSLDPDLLEEEGVEALAREGFSPAFIALIEAALAAGVHFVRFDADAPRHAALPDASAAWGRRGRGGTTRLG